jgi:hypothetical protein
MTLQYSDTSRTVADRMLMTTWFKPSRRKIGVVTLLMACVFSIGWVRSTVVEDVFTLKFNKKRVDRLISSVRYRGIMWQGICFPEHHMKLSPTSWVSMNGADPRTRHWYGADEWTGQFFRSKNEISAAGVRSSLMLISYGVIAIPLTLLSVYLLLSKPRKPKSGQTQIEDHTTIIRV